jgi:hypothetical protein
VFCDEADAVLAATWMGPAQNNYIARLAVEQWTKKRRRAIKRTNADIVRLFVHYWAYTKNSSMHMSLLELRHTVNGSSIRTQWKPGVPESGGEMPTIQDLHYQEKKYVRSIRYYCIGLLNPALCKPV